MSSEPAALTAPWPARLESVNRCPVCGDSQRKPEVDNVYDGAYGAAPGAWSLQRCEACRALYLDPRPDPSSIHLAYHDYYTHAADAGQSRSLLRTLTRALSNGYRNKLFRTRLRPALNVGAWIMPLFASTAAHIRREDRGLRHAAADGSRMLDVGCGNGRFLVWARELGWQCYGVEMDPVASAVARDQGIAILGSQIHDLDGTHDGTFDAITLSHVIEHVYDPVEMLRHCRRLLKPGGYLWIETPNTNSLGYQEYGVHWRGLEAPRHLVLFNSTSLRWALQHAGFAGMQVLPPVDVSGPMFQLSATMQLGRIAEKDHRPLPRDVRAAVESAARRSRDRSRRNAEEAEFITAIAYRPFLSR